MLVLGNKKPRARLWKEAAITLHLIPLPQDKDQEFTDQTTTIIRDEDGKVERIKKDVQAYAELIGQYCIKGWEGVVDADGNDLPCTPEYIAEFMNILPAQNFVVIEVQGLSMHMNKELAEGKNG